LGNDSPITGSSATSSVRGQVGWGVRKTG
jgi:hypothetical protein